jgi:hypothetical protein
MLRKVGNNAIKKIYRTLERAFVPIVQKRFSQRSVMMSSRVWYAFGLGVVALLLVTGLWSNLGNSSLSETNADANASHKLPDLSAHPTGK